MVMKAGRSVAVQAGVGEVYQLWVGKSGGGGAKSREVGTITWVSMVGAGGMSEQMKVRQHVWKAAEVVACLTEVWG